MLKKRGFRLLAVLGTAGLLAGIAAAPAIAGGSKTPSEVLPSLTVTKVVVAGATSWTIPSSELFTIQVSCHEVEGEAAPLGGDDGFDATLTFNGDGTTHSAPGGWVDGGNSWTLQGWDLKNTQCTVTEAAGGATKYNNPATPTYACSTSTEAIEVADEAGAEGDDKVVETTCLSDNSLTLGNPYDRTCWEKPSAADYPGPYCYHSGVVTVTNTIGEDPAKVAPAAVTVTPKFTG